MKSMGKIRRGGPQPSIIPKVTSPSQGPLILENLLFSLKPAKYTDPAVRPCLASSTEECAPLHHVMKEAKLLLRQSPCGASENRRFSTSPFQNKSHSAVVDGPNFVIVHWPPQRTLVFEGNLFASSIGTSRKPLSPSVLFAATNGAPQTKNIAPCGHY